MAKTPDKSKKGGDESAADHYKLKIQAVEDLVTADESNAPEVSKAELERYGGRQKRGIPGWLKVGFIKWWFPGAVYYFIVMGLGLNQVLDLVVIPGVILGMVADLLTDNVIRFFAPTEGEYDSYLMFSKKRYLTFILNIVYAMALCAVVFSGIYPLVGLVVDLNTIPRSILGEIIMGPVGFGLFYMLSDLALVGVKYLIKKAVRGPKNKNVQEG